MGDTKSDTKSDITVELTDEFYVIDMTKDFKRMYELYDEAYFSLLGLRYDHRFSPARMTGGASQYLDKSMEFNPIAYWLDAVIMNPFSQAITDMFVKDDANRQKPDTNTLAETSPTKDNAEADEQEREKSMTDKGAEFFNKSWITGSVKKNDQNMKTKKGKSWFSFDTKKDEDEDEDEDGDKDKSWLPFPKNPDNKDKDKDKSWLPDNLLFQEKEEDRLLNQSIDSAFKPPDESTVMPGIGHIKPVELPESPIEEEEEEVPKLVEEKIEEKVEVKAFHIRNTNTNTDMFDHNTNSDSDSEPMILDGLSLDKIIEERAKNITIETFMTGLTYHEAETILRDIQIQVDHFASLDKPVDIKLSNVFFVNGRFLVLSVKHADNPKMMYTVLRQVLVNANEPSFDAEWRKIENTELWKKYNKLYENP